MESCVCIRVWLWREGVWLIHLLVNLTSTYINTPEPIMAPEITPYPISMCVCMYECLCVSVSIQIWKHWRHIQEQVKNHVLCHKREGQGEEKSVVHTRRRVLLYWLQANLCNEFYLLTAIVCVIQFQKTQTHFISLSTKRARWSVCPWWGKVCEGKSIDNSLWRVCLGLCFCESTYLIFLGWAVTAKDNRGHHAGG